MFKAAVALIENTFSTAWTVTSIDWDNVNFKPVLGTAFARLQIEWVDSNQVSIGGRTRGEGYIDISIFVPGNTGTQAANDLADQAAAIFFRFHQDGLICGVARTVRVGNQEEWYQLKVLIPFKYDECSTN